MTTLVLTLVGDDRAGIVASVAAVVDAAGGNWENSQLAELSGAFAGIVEVSVPAERAEALREQLRTIDGLLTVAVPVEPGRRSAPADGSRRIGLQVIGNDHPGIVRDVSAALSTHGLSIERMTTETRDAAMSGGRLFEATIAAVLPAGVGLEEVRAELERLAAEIQVDVAFSD